MTSTVEGHEGRRRGQGSESSETEDMNNTSTTERFRLRSQRLAGKQGAHASRGTYKTKSKDPVGGWMKGTG